MQFGIQFALQPIVSEAFPAEFECGIQWNFEAIVPETGVVRLVFRDSNTSVALAGITIGLYEENGTFVGEYTSDSSGVIEVPDLLPGLYRIEQLGDYAGYRPFDEREFYIVVGAETAITVSMMSLTVGTRWMDLYDHLKAKGFEVYPPASKRGQCLQPYVVAMQESTMELYGFSSEQDYYSVMCYVPINQYMNIQKFVNSVKLAMKSAYPMFTPSGNVTQPYLDTAIHGWMVSIEYVNYRKVNLLY